MSRSRRSFWALVSGIAFLAVTPVIALVSTPLLLRFLGSERFGAFRAASDWGGYLALLELGLGGALLPLLARALGRGDAEATQTALVAGLRAYLRITALMLAGGAALAVAIPWLVPVRPDLVGELRAGVWVGVIGLVFVPLAPFRLLAEAAQRGYVVNSLLLVQSLLVTGAAVLLAWDGWGIVGQYAAVLIGAVPFNLLLTWDASRRYPGLAGRLLGAPADADLNAKLRSLSGPSLLLNICGRVGMLTDNIIIAALLGPSLVVPFFLTQRMAQMVQSLLQGLGNSSWAGLAELYVKEEFETFHRRLYDLTSLTAVLGVGCLVPVAAYNRHFIELWIGADHYGGGAVTVLAAVNGLMLALVSLWGWVFAGTGQVRRLIPILVASTVLNVTVSIGATWLIGLPGPLIGTSAGLAGVMLWAVPWQMHRVFGTPLARLCRAAAMPIALGLPYAALLWWFAAVHEPWGWLGLAGEMAVAVAVYLLLAWWLVLDWSERIFWRQRFQLAVPWLTRV